MPSRQGSSPVSDSTPSRIRPTWLLTYTATDPPLSAGGTVELDGFFGWRLARCVDDEIAVQIEQHMVGGKELKPGAGRLRDDEAVERVMPDQFGKLADRLGVLGGDAEHFHALPGKLLAEVVRHGQLAEHALDRQFPYCRRRDVHALRGGYGLPCLRPQPRAVIQHPQQGLAVKKQHRRRTSPGCRGRRRTRRLCRRSRP